MSKDRTTVAIHEDRSIAGAVRTLDDIHPAVRSSSSAVHGRYLGSSPFFHDQRIRCQMKRIFQATIATAVLGAVAVSPAMGATKAAAGKTCKTVGTNSGSLTCTKQGTKNVWRATPRPTAAPTTGAAQPAPTAAPATTAAPAKEAAWPDRLRLAPVPAENASSTVTSWTPFAKALEKEIGIPVEIITTTSYAGVTEALVGGRIDMAMYGPFSYYLAKASGAKVEPIGIYVSQIGRPPVYYSVLVAKSSRSDIRTIADVKGKKVCFVDPQSTSGYLYPFLALIDAGIDPEKDITAIFAGGHDRSAIAVNNGTCDAGFAFENMVFPLSPKEPATLTTRGVLKDGDLKLIQKSKPIPESPLAIRTDLPASLVAKVKTATLNIDALYLQANKLCPAASPRCGIFGANDSDSTFVPATDSFFNDIKVLCTNPVAPKACKPA